MYNLYIKSGGGVRVDMHRKGFTLVEVLIVVIIIGILAAIGVPQFADSIEKAKGGEARAGLGHIQTAEKVYYAERDVYTTDISNDLDVNLTERYWAFQITAGSTTYLATATRSGGPRNGQTISMDERGNITGNWEFL